MNRLKSRNKLRKRRKLRNRAKIFGTPEKPRLSIFRSNKHTYIQLIDDTIGKTLLAISTHDSKKTTMKTKVEKSRLLGEILSEKAQKLGIKKMILNKGHYAYHGRIKAVVEEARKQGLII